MHKAIELYGKAQRTLGGVGVRLKAADIATLEELAAEYLRLMLSGAPAVAVNECVGDENCWNCGRNCAVPLECGPENLPGLRCDEWKAKEEPDDHTTPEP